MKIKRLEAGSAGETRCNIPHERRHHKRLDVRQLKLDIEMPSASLVKVMNVSSGGVLVMADRLLNTGRKYSLRIRYKDKMLFVKTIARWSSLIESLEDADGNLIPICMAGMQFTDVMKGDVREIMSLVEADIHGIMYNASIESLLESTPA